MGDNNRCPDPYEAGAAYSTGDVVFSVVPGAAVVPYGLVYRCAPVLKNLFCSTPGYEVGVGPYSDATWTLLRSCEVGNPPHRASIGL